MANIGSADAATAVREIRRAQRADGPAAVLAIGTANPTNCLSQDEFPGFYFRLTKRDHLTDLKDKFQSLCERLGVKKRFFHYDEDLLNAHPGFLDGASPSLDARQDIAATAVPELAAKASDKAIHEWGRPATEITHLVVATNSGAHTPGVDFHLIRLLGLRPTIRRTMIHLNGCSAGSAALRLAKDLAENNRGARVLVVCAELVSVMLFSAPEEGCFQTLINQALFGDGAGTVVVGADPMCPEESPLFEMVSASQTVIPESEHTVEMHLTKDGLRCSLYTAKQISGFIGGSMERCLLESFGASGIGAANWNDLFWVVHPGAAAVTNGLGAALQLEPEKLAASRHVLSEYGNMFGATVIFVLDEMRRRLMEQMKQGEEAPGWGMMVAFGPGITVEMMLLHATRFKHHPKESVD